MAIGAILATGAITGAQLAANYFTAKKTAEQNQKYAQENQQQSYELSQQAQRNAAANEMAGLRAAGLSPALANGAAAASIPSSQGGTMQTPNMDLMANKMLLTQMKNVEAQTEATKAMTAKTEAETKNVEQQTGERQTAGNTWSMNLYHMYSELAESTDDKSKKAFYESMADEARDAGVFATGAAEARKAFNQLQAENFESRERILKARVLALIDEAQWNEASKYGDFLNDLRDAPRRESNLLASQIAKFAADKKNLEALALLATSQKNLSDEQLNQVRAMTERLESYNLPALLKKGDTKGFLAAVLGLLIEGVASHPVMAR